MKDKKSGNPFDCVIVEETITILIYEIISIIEKSKDNKECIKEIKSLLQSYIDVNNLTFEDVETMTPEKIWKPLGKYLFCRKKDDGTVEIKECDKMKFILNKNKFKRMLELLIMGDMFRISTITVKKNKLISYEKEENGGGLRAATFNKSYFDELQGNDSIKINVKNLLSFIKKIPKNTSIVFEKKDEHVLVTYQNKSIKIKYETPDPDEVQTVFPFKIIEGIPYIKEIPLNVYFTILQNDLADLALYANDLNTEFYQFFFKDNDIYGRVTNLRDESDEIDIKFQDKKVITTVIENGKERDKIKKLGIKKGSDLFVTFTYGLPQMAKAFSYYKDNIIHIKTGTDKLAWIYSKNYEYTVGFLVPPLVKEEVEKRKRGEW